MLAIRMQRTGRKGYAQFRIVVQDSRQTPSSARVVASIGSYNPHTKEAIIDTEKAKFYLKNGAQPSNRVVSLLKKEGLKMPSWVEAFAKQKKATKNPEKLRKNRPAEPEVKQEAPVEPAEPTEEAPTERAESTVETPETPGQETTELQTEEAPTELVEKVVESPAKEDAEPESKKEAK